MILGANGRPYVTLGGATARTVRQRGDLIQSFQYINTEPAMLIWSGSRKAGAFAICLSAAHQYMDDEYCVLMAMRAAEQIGYSPGDKGTVHKIIDLILDGMDELVRMPPEPESFVAERSQRAEVKLMHGGANGDVISHQEIAHDPLAPPDTGLMQ